MSFVDRDASGRSGHSTRTLVAPISHDSPAWSDRHRDDGTTPTRSDFAKSFGEAVIGAPIHPTVATPASPAKPPT